MKEIILKRANVVKHVDSEDKAKTLEAKGFVRTDGKTVFAASSADEVKKLKTQLVEAGKVLENADKRRGELEEELAETKEKLEEADKKIESLVQELAGTKEQLEAAIKKNKAADKKNKEEQT